MSLQPAFGNLNQQLFCKAHSSHFSGWALTHTFGAACGGRTLAGWRRSKKSWQQDGGAEAGDSALPLARGPRCRLRRPLDVRLTPRAGSGERANCSFPWPGTGIGVRVCLLRPRKGVKSEKKKKVRESGRPSVIQDTHSQCNECRGPCCPPPPSIEFKFESMRARFPAAPRQCAPLLVPWRR